MKNPVAKFNNEFNKPKVFRDRKKQPSKAKKQKIVQEGLEELKHKDAVPYRRENRGNLRKHFEEEDVNNDWYVVFNRHSKWWFTDLDDVLRREHGPFDTETEAHEGAFRYTQEDGV